jgi:hypothetical protein
VRLPKPLPIHPINPLPSVGKAASDAGKAVASGVSGGVSTAKSLIPNPLSALGIIPSVASSVGVAMLGGLLITLGIVILVRKPLGNAMGSVSSVAAEVPKV